MNETFLGQTFDPKNYASTRAAAQTVCTGGSIDFVACRSPKVRLIKGGKAA